MKKNKKIDKHQVPKIASIGIISTAVIAIGVGTKLGIDHSHDYVSTLNNTTNLSTAKNYIYEFDSAAINDDGSLPTNTFFTIFELIHANYDLKVAVQKALERSLTISVSENNTQIQKNLNQTDWQVKQEPIGADGAVYIENKNTNETIKIVDKAGYYKNPLSIGDALMDLLPNGQKQITSVIDYGKYLNLLKENAFVKINDNTFQKIKAFITSSSPTLLTNIAVAKIILNPNDKINSKIQLVVVGTNANNQHVVYTITGNPNPQNTEDPNPGMPVVYGFDDVKNELPSFDEVVNENFDYKQAIIKKLKSFNGNSQHDFVFNGKLNRQLVLDNAEKNIAILKDNSISISDTHHLIYITKGNEGYSYERLDRGINQVDSKYPFKYNLLEFVNLINVLTNNNESGAKNAIILTSVLNNSLFSKYIVDKGFNNNLSKIYYEPEHNRIIIRDDTNGARKAVMLVNLPNVLKVSNVINNQSKNINNKPLLDIQQILQSFISQVHDFKKHDVQMLEIFKHALLENLKLASGGKIGSISVEGIPSIDNSVEQNQNLLPQDSKYKYLKINYTKDNQTKSYYILYANTYESVNGNGLIFKDKLNYVKNENKVVATYLTISNIGLVDLNNYLDQKYPNPLFSKNDSKIIRYTINHQQQKTTFFVIINTNHENDLTKFLIIYNLPHVLSTTETFNNYDNVASLDKLVDQMLVNQDNKSDKELFIKILNDNVRRSSSDVTKIVVDGNEYTLSTEDNNGVKFDFNLEQSNKLINLIRNQDQKIIEQIKVDTNDITNPNGLIPTIKKVRWNKSDRDSFSFYKRYEQLVNDPTHQGRKVLTNELLNDQLIKENVGNIKSGTIEYKYDQDFIIIRDYTTQQAVIFTNVPKITTVAEMFWSLKNINFNNTKNNLTDVVMQTYGTTPSKPNDFNNQAFIESIINAQQSGNLILGNYTIAKDQKKYVIKALSAPKLDQGPNNTTRRYKTFVYEIVDQANPENKIKIYDESNYLDSKKAYELYGSNVSFNQWKALYEALNNKNSYEQGLDLAQVQTIAPNFVQPLTNSIEQGGFGFFLNVPTGISNPQWKKVKVFLCEKNNQKQLVIAGWRNPEVNAFYINNNPGKFSILNLYNLPNIINENDEKLKFTLPTKTEIIASDGNYEKALDLKLKAIVKDGAYDLPYLYNTNQDNSLSLNPNNLKFEIDEQNRNYIKLYRGTKTSFGSLIIFANQQIPNVIGTSYSSSNDYYLTWEYWTKLNNANVDNTIKTKLLKQLIDTQNQNDLKFKAFNFQLSSNSGIEFIKDEGKIIVYENINDKQNSKIALIYNIPKVISNHDIFETKPNSLLTEINVLQSPNNGDLNKAINNQIENHLDNLIVENKLFGLTYQPNTPITYSLDNHTINFANHHIYIVNLEEYKINSENLFSNVLEYKKSILGEHSLKEFEQREDVSLYNNNVDIQKIISKAVEINLEAKKVFKVGSKIVLETIDKTKPNTKVYLIFVGAPNFSTDLNEQITWLNVYDAIDFANQQPTFSTVIQNQLIKKAILDAKPTVNGLIKLGQIKFDPNTMHFDLTKNNHELITNIHISDAKSLDLLIENPQKIAILDSSNLDTFIKLDNKVNIEKVRTLITAIKNASKTTINNKAIIDYNSIDGINLITPNNKIFDKIWYDEAKQNIWLIDSINNKGYAITNIPDFTEIVMDKDLAKNQFLATKSLTTNDLSPKTLISNYLQNISLSTKQINDFTLSGEISFNNIENYYVITYASNPIKRLVLIDQTKYHLATSEQINAQHNFNDVSAFKKLFEEVKKTKDLTTYANLAQNSELDTLINNYHLEKNSVKLLVDSYDNKNVLLLTANDSAQNYHVYFIYNLPKITEPSKLKIPTVYDFIKYKGNEQKRLEEAIKNELDETPSKTNQTIMIYDRVVDWNNANVIIDRANLKIKIEDKTAQKYFDEKTFSNIPEFKIVNANNASDEEIYELISAFKKLNTDSEVDKSKDNTLVNNLHPQKQINNEFLNNKIIKEKIKAVYGDNNNLFADLNHVSVEYYLEPSKHSDNDRIIIRVFDAQNQLTHALVITNIRRVVKNNVEITVSEDELISAIVEHNDPSRAYLTKTINSINGQQITAKLGDFTYSKNSTINQNNAKYYLEDGNHVFQPITILDAIDPIPYAINLEDEIVNIKEYQKAFNQIKQNSGILLSNLNNQELNSVVNTYGNGMNITTTTVEVRNNNMLFKDGNKLLVATKLPIVIDLTNTTDNETTKIPSFDEIVKTIAHNKSVLNAYEACFKDTNNYPVNEQKITIVSKANNQSYSLNINKMVIKFNDDNSLTLTDLSTRQTINLIVDQKLESNSILVVNALGSDVDQVFAFTQLITSKATPMAMTEAMKQATFIVNNPLIPQSFFNDLTHLTIKYLVDQNKIVIENTNNKHSIIIYNVPRTLKATDVYSIDDIVKADVRVQNYLKNKLNDASKYNQTIQWGDLTIEYAKSQEQAVKVINVGLNNNSLISSPTNSSKPQVSVIDKMIYHLGIEKIDASVEISNVVDFDKYQKTITDTFSTINADDLPKELKQKVFNANYGNIDLATAQIKKIVDQTNAKNTKLVVYGTNLTNRQTHVIVINNFPTVYNPASDNDVLAPTVQQLTATQNIDQDALYSPNDIMAGVLKDLLKDTNNKIMHTDFDANSVSIVVNRPNANIANPTNKDYSYSITSAQKTITLIPNAIVPEIYGYDSVRINHQALDTAHFEKTYNELIKNQQVTNLTTLKTDQLIKSLISSTSIDQKLQAWFKDDAILSSSRVVFDKTNKRILILNDDKHFLVIFGNILKAATADNATNNVLYTISDVVNANGNLANVITNKLNRLQPQKISVNGYEYTKNFTPANLQTDGVYLLHDNAATSQDLYFIDETIYTHYDAKSFAFSNLVDFYNKTILKLQQAPIGTQLDALNLDCVDFNNLIQNLEFDQNQAQQIVLGNDNERLGIIGIDWKTKKLKVVILSLPAIKKVDFDLSLEDVTNTDGQSLDEKIANATKQKILAANSTNKQLKIADQIINLDDPKITYQTKPNPTDANKKIVELVKDNQVIATLVLRNDTPNVKVIDWTSINATPLQTYNVLENITKNSAIDTNYPHQKQINWINLANQTDAQNNLFSIDFIAKALASNQISNISNEPNRSIEYNQNKNEIILRSKNTTAIFINVYQVVNANLMYDSAQGYIKADSELINSKNPYQALVSYFNNLQKDFKDQTKMLSDSLHHYKVSANSAINDLSNTYQDAFTYEFSSNDQTKVYVIDQRQYEITPINAQQKFTQNLNDFVKLRDALSTSEFKNISDYNNKIINQFAQEHQLIEPQIIKSKHDNKLVFVLVGKKLIERHVVNNNQTTNVSEYVECIYLINVLPIIPDKSVLALLPSDDEIISNGGDQATLIQQKINDPIRFPPFGQPPMIDFGGIKLQIGIKKVDVLTDGTITIVDANDQQVSIPASNTTKIYGEYDVDIYSDQPNDDALDFRFTNILLAKELYDAIDNQQPILGVQRPLTDVIKNNVLLKKIIDNYNLKVKNLVGNDWDLSKATISYNRVNNTIIIRDNLQTNTSNPRIVIIKNAPRIIDAYDLYNKDEYYFKAADFNNDITALVKNKVKEIISSSNNVSSYFIGNQIANQYQTITGYDNLANIEAGEQAYANAPNTWYISYNNSLLKRNQQKLFIIDKTQYLATQNPRLTNLVALYDQLKTINDDYFNASNLEYSELKQIVQQAINEQDLSNVRLKIYHQVLIVQALNDQKQVIKDVLISLPKLIDQSKAKLPSKEDIVNFDKPINELILLNFQDENKFVRNSSNQIEVDGVLFNPFEVDIVQNNDGTISINQKDSQPPKTLATIIANNPSYPQRLFIDNKDKKYHLERDPMAIYELVKMINKLPANVNSFINLTKEMKQNSFLKPKLDAVFEPNWYNTTTTKIRYDIANNRLIIDNNNHKDNKILVIKNIDRVLLATDNDYTLYTPNTIASGYTISVAQDFSEQKISADEIITKAIAKNLLKMNFLKPVHNFVIKLKNNQVLEQNDLTYINDLNHDVFAVSTQAPKSRRYLQLTTANNQQYIIIDDTYYHFSKTKGFEIFNDNLSFKKLFNNIIKANQKLEITVEIEQKTPELTKWLDELKQDDGLITSNNPKYLNSTSGPNLVLRYEQDQVNYVSIINNVPRVLSEKDINLHLPSEADVLNNQGNYAQTIAKILKDPKQYPRDPNNKINVNGLLIDPDQIKVIVRDDGTIDLIDKNNANLLLSISPTRAQPNYTVINAELNDAVEAKALYELIKQTRALIQALPHQKNMNDLYQSEKQRLINHPWIIKNIISVYEAINNPANIVTDFKNWTVEYNPNLDKLIFRGMNTDREKRAQTIVVNNVIKVIRASELYSTFDILVNNNDQTLIDDAINLTINQKLANANQIGDYLVNNPVLVNNYYENHHALVNKTQQAKYKIISDQNNHQIVIIDDIFYIKKAKATSIFKDYLAFKKLDQTLSLNKNIDVKLMNEQQEFINDELKNYVLKLNNQEDLKITDLVITKIDNFFVIKGTLSNGKYIVQKLYQLPNVISKQTIPYISIDDVLNANGDEALAMHNLLKNKAKYPIDKNGLIRLQNAQLDPNKIVVEKDENGDLNIFKLDENNQKIKPPAAIILSKLGKNDIKVNYVKVDGSQFWPSYLQEIIGDIYTAKNFESIDEQVKPLNLVKNNQIIHDVLPKNFKNGPLATIQFDAQRHQIVIKDNDTKNPNVVVISTKSITNSSFSREELVHYRAKNDYWMIWVAVISIAAIIGIIIGVGLLIYFFKNKHLGNKKMNKNLKVRKMGIVYGKK
ncbi:GUMAP protein [Ureaplasma urealyticum]|uniref:GUMAP protein n=1 Tax=Ureaplasma urealyticum TaxID=2130 RepID=A0ABD4SMC0_UREUR|nr:GUMAP protein [Ureaplasma urealyticum]MCF1349274.1 GUMAP protein [Ureaplasma urealyticum]